MQGLDQNEQEEFAASFSDNLAAAAIAAGEFGVARAGLHDAPLAVQRQPEPAAEGASRPEAAGQGRQARAVVRESRTSRERPSASTPTAASTSWSISGRPGAPPASPSCPGCRPPIAPITMPASRSSASAWTSPRRPSSISSRRATSPGRSSTTPAARPTWSRRFGVSSIPATYLIDPEGTIIRLDLRGKALDETLAPADQDDSKSRPRHPMMSCLLSAESVSHPGNSGWGVSPLRLVLHHHSSE